MATKIIIGNEDITSDIETMTVGAPRYLPEDPIANLVCISYPDGADISYPDDTEIALEKFVRISFSSEATSIKHKVLAWVDTQPYVDRDTTLLIDGEEYAFDYQSVSFTQRPIGVRVFVQILCRRTFISTVHEYKRLIDSTRELL